MAKFEEQFNRAKQVKMTNDERNVMRTSLARLVYQTSVSRVGILSAFSLRTYMPIILIIAVLLGGGVSVAAERALPGEVLYPVKVSVNEKVVSAFRVSEESRANWEIRLAERRLEEAEELSERGEIEASVLTRIESNFEDHADRVKDRIVKFQEKQNFQAAADVSERFETSLEAHEVILVKLSGDDARPLVVSSAVEVEANGDHGALLIDKVRAELDEVGRLKIEIEVEAESESNLDSELDEDLREIEVELRGN